MTPQPLTSSSEDQTNTIAADLAETLQQGDCVLLDGPMGAGKSVFARALIRTLTENPAEEVPSPTFTLVQSYIVRKNTETPFPLYHYDLYRLKDPEEVLELGWQDGLAKGLSIVEWPSRLGHFKPLHAKLVTIEILDENKRTISITNV